MRVLRRHFLVGTARWMLPPTAYPLAICSETFVGMGFAEACRAARRIGYDGIEIEPAHLDANPALLPASRRRQIRAVMESEGLRCPAFHSLLRMPSGLHLTTPDASVRRKSWEYFARLIELAADIAGRPLMVLGSARQRDAIAGSTPKEAAKRLASGLAQVAPLAEQRGLCILLEPLAPHLCNVINTLAEAIAIIREVGSPALATILDTHNTAAETEEIEELVGRYLPLIRHVHLNEMDGRRPGTGDYPFARLLAALRRCGYQGWLSVEVFDFAPSGETVARQSLEYLRKLQQVTGPAAS